MNELIMKKVDRPPVPM